MPLPPPARPNSFWGAVWAGIATPRPWARQEVPLKPASGYRSADLAGKRPDLLCDVTLYPTDQGGRRGPLRGDMHRWFACPCKVSAADARAWEGRFLLEGEVVKPGERRRLGVTFQDRAALAALAPLGRFYLWEGRAVGEAVVVGAEG